MATLNTHSQTRTSARALVALASTAALGLTGCGNADAGDASVERNSFAFSGKTLTIDSDDSAVELMPADITDVQVARQVDGWTLTGDGPEPTWTMAEGKLTLRVKCYAVAASCTARHTVKVPRGVAVTVKDGSGGVTASGFETALTIRSASGKVTIRDSNGPLQVDSDNGEVLTERISSKTVHATSGLDHSRARAGLR